MNDGDDRQEETQGNEEDRFVRTSGTSSGLHKGTGINWQNEFKEGVNKGLFYEKMATVAMAFMTFMNPAEILKEIQELDDKTKQQIQEQLQSFMIEYLEMRLNVMKEGKTLPEDIIGLAKDMARLDRKRFQK